MNRAAKEEIGNIHQLIGCRYEKSCNHWSIAYQAIGKDNSDARTTSFMNPYDNIEVMERTLAPRTFRMPISFTRCSALNAASAKRPMLPINIAMPVKIRRRVPSLSSARYILAKLSSIKEYSSGSGTYFFQAVRICARAASVFSAFTLTAIL